MATMPPRICLCASGATGHLVILNQRRDKRRGISIDPMMEEQLTRNERTQNCSLQTSTLRSVNQQQP
jgi:hypothetical protein